MKIVHASDWHGDWRAMPKGDLYVITGDMLDNYPEVNMESVHSNHKNEWGKIKPEFADQYQGSSTRMIVRDVEIAKQTAWLKAQGDMRRFLGSPDSPVIVCRGNHDYVDLGPAFSGDVYEIGNDASVVFEFQGIRFGGVRGINYFQGEWEDELTDPEFDDRVRLLPRDLDVLITHSPPQDILDFLDGYGNIGSKQISAYLNEITLLQGPLKLHLFGHVHDQGGRIAHNGGIIFSNAATTCSVIQI